MSDTTDLIIEKAVVTAGDYLAEQFRKHHHTSQKTDGSVLLEEDLTSEKIIVELIRKNRPHDTILTEETDYSEKGEIIWIIDPLCGTYSYLRGVETWSVSLACVENGRYVAGAVYQPLLKTLFFGSSGAGVTRNGHPVAPSTISELKDAFVSVEHGVFLDDSIDLFTLIRSLKRVRVGHGSGMELAYVASGSLDAVIKTSQTAEHYSGGRALIELAGGIFVDFTGKPLPVITEKQTKVNYLAANKNISEKILKFVNKGPAS